MTTTQKNIGAVKDPEQSKGQFNPQSVDRKQGPEHSIDDNDENHVSNGTQSEPSQPGIAKVGNTGAPNE